MIAATVKESTFLEGISEIADAVARPAADIVDREARFPIEAYNALRAASALSAHVAPAFGGGGARSPKWRLHASSSVGRAGRREWSMRCTRSRSDASHGTAPARRSSTSTWRPSAKSNVCSRRRRPSWASAATSGGASQRSCPTATMRAREERPDGLVRRACG